MANMFDLTNSNNISKKLIDKNKRIESQIAETVNKYNADQKALNEQKEKAQNDAALTSARFSIGSTYARSKNRINSLNEEINYTNRSSITGMSEMVANVVENALLLDEAEFAALNPNYKHQIREIISGFLKEGNINENIKNKDTLALMEYVAKRLPSVKEGLSLTEDDLRSYIEAGKPVNIDKSIKNLSGDVSRRVANLVEKEQAKVKEIESEVGQTKKDEDKKAKDNGLTFDDVMQMIDAGEVDEDKLEEMLKNGEVSRDVYDDVNNFMNSEGKIQPGDDAPAEDEELSDEEIPEDGDELSDDSEISAAPVASGNPKKQIQMLPDGTMNINIFEKQNLVRETPRCGLLESLAVNEAANMLKEGKDYNPDLALANAIMYITITEAMDQMGLMNVGEKEYAHIISAAGGTLKENENKKAQVKVAKKEVEVKLEKPLDLSERIRQKRKVNEPKEERKDEKEEVKENKKSLHEGVICAQEKPILNTYNSNDLSERIRQKRLNQNKNLNE